MSVVDYLFARNLLHRNQVPVLTPDVGTPLGGGDGRSTAIANLPER
ncbi:hypothetical protein [Microcoleus sp. EPA2]